MQISISYEPTAEELAKASSLFIEKKPFMFYSIGFLNAFAYFILFIILLKAILVKNILPNEILAGIAACIWLFGRRPFNEWLLHQRMKRSLLVNSTLTVDISLNGIAWAGKRVVTASLKWDEISYILETKEGFILPIGGSQFLWLPFRGFTSPNEIEIFKQSIQEHQIKIREVGS